MKTKTRKLTVKQLLVKFPDLEVMENCLLDMVCPECGNREIFKIEMTSQFEITDEGTGDNDDTEWGPTSFCKCCDCEHDGKARDFTFKGLDEALTEREDDRADANQNYN